MIAIYTRQSIDKKDSISIETQVEMCQKEIKTQGLEFKIYKDKGFSGKNTDRPAFQNLLPPRRVRPKFHRPVLPEYPPS